MDLNHEHPLVPKKLQPCLTKHWVSTSRQLTRIKLESLRKERDHWRTRAEARTTAQDKKEEAWELFQRQSRLGSDAKERSSSGSTSRKRKSTHLSVLPVQVKKVSASMGGRSAQNRGTRPKEGSQREAEHGAGGFQPPETWSMGEDMGSASPRAVSCSWKLSRDVRLDVELTALVSSVETTSCSNSI